MTGEEVWLMPCGAGPPVLLHVGPSESELSEARARSLFMRGKISVDEFEALVDAALRLPDRR